MNAKRLLIAALALALDFACGDVPIEDDPSGTEEATGAASRGNEPAPPLTVTPPAGSGGSGGKTGNYCNGIGQSCQDMCHSAGYRKGTCDGNTCKCSGQINCRTCPNLDRLPL